MDSEKNRKLLRDLFQVASIIANDPNYENSSKENVDRFRNSFNNIKNKYLNNASSVDENEELNNLRNDYDNVIIELKNVTDELENVKRELDNVRRNAIDYGAARNMYGTLLPRLVDLSNKKREYEKNSLYLKRKIDSLDIMHSEVKQDYNEFRNDLLDLEIAVDKLGIMPENNVKVKSICEDIINTHLISFKNGHDDISEEENIKNNPVIENNVDKANDGFDFAQIFKENQNSFKSDYGEVKLEPEVGVKPGDFVKYSWVSSSNIGHDPLAYIDVDKVYKVSEVDEENGLCKLEDDIYDRYYDVNCFVKSLTYSKDKSIEEEKHDIESKKIKIRSDKKGKVTSVKDKHNNPSFIMKSLAIGSVITMPVIGKMHQVVSAITSTIIEIPSLSGGFEKVRNNILEKIKNKVKGLDNSEEFQDVMELVNSQAIEKDSSVKVK